MTSFPTNKVELHIHVDCAVRAETIWELSKQKNLPLPGNGSVDALKEAFVVKHPTTLCDYLKSFKWITPAIEGDPNAIERITYELCEDKAKEGVLYLEMRGSPHLLLGKHRSMSSREVMESFLRGIHRGEKDFGIKSRFIICCMRNLPEFASDVVALADEFRNDGIVGIDVAGDEAQDVDPHGEEHFHENIIAAYQEARSRNIHRTAHAGEAGPANGVLKAIDLLGAERIGHGYHVVDDPSVYHKAMTAGIHFETCPYSSILTGAVKPGVTTHPIVRFAKDDANFSIGTDGPTATNTTLLDEYKLLRTWGLSNMVIHKANINAIRASFLPDDEKEELLTAFKSAADTENNNTESLLN